MAIVKLHLYLLLLLMIACSDSGNPLLGKWDLKKGVEGHQFAYCDRLVFTSDLQVCDGKRTSISFARNGGVWRVFETGIMDGSWSFRVLDQNKIGLVFPNGEQAVYVRVRS